MEYVFKQICGLEVFSPHSDGFAAILGPHAYWLRRRDLGKYAMRVMMKRTS
jgi:hypothetical protein